MGVDGPAVAPVLPSEDRDCVCPASYGSSSSSVSFAAARPMVHPPRCRSTPPRDSPACLSASPSQGGQALGLTRRVAIPLLEMLDPGQVNGSEPRHDASGTRTM